MTLDNFCKKICTFAQVAPRGHCLDMPVQHELGCCRPFTSNIVETSCSTRFASFTSIQFEHPLGAAATVTPVGAKPWLQVPWPGQPRLDSGSLSAGWFPLPDAVRRLLGCHPCALPLSVFVDLRAALGHVGCCASAHAVTVVGDRRS